MCSSVGPANRAGLGYLPFAESFRSRGGGVLGTRLKGPPNPEEELSFYVPSPVMG